MNTCRPMEKNMETGGIRLTFSDDGIAMVTMCNGENKFNPEYVKRWHDVMDKIDRNPNTRAMITTGDGKFFTTGMDVDWLKRSSPEILDRYHDELHRLYIRILTLGVTTVAVINGHAVAEGAFIALMHDFRIMRSDRGWLTWPEVHMKLPMTNVMLDLIRAKVQPGVVQREAFVFGKRFDAKTAKSLGLVDKMVPADRLLTEARETVNAALGKNAFLTQPFRTMKEDIYRSDSVAKETRTKANL